MAHQATNVTAQVKEQADSTALQQLANRQIGENISLALETEKLFKLYTYRIITGAEFNEHIAKFMESYYLLSNSIAEAVKAEQAKDEE